MTPDFAYLLNFEGDRRCVHFTTMGIKLRHPLRVGVTRVHVTFVNIRGNACVGLIRKVRSSCKESAQW